LLPSSLVWLLIVIAFAGSNTAGLLMVLLLAFALMLVVLAHRSLRRSRGNSSARGDRPLLRTPGQVTLAVAILVVLGCAAGALTSIALGTVASSLVGDGNLLVRLCVGVFAFAGGMVVGSRCGQWWAFLGATGLIPLFALSVLISGRAESGIGLAVVSILSVAFAVATGSLNQQLAPVRRNRARTFVTAKAEALRPDRQSGRAAPSASRQALRQDRRAAAHIPQRVSPEGNAASGDVRSGAGSSR
jgi:hypothetical protein